MFVGIKLIYFHRSLPQVARIHNQPSSEQLGSFALCFLASASSAAAPSNMLAAVRIEGLRERSL